MRISSPVIVAVKVVSDEKTGNQVSFMTNLLKLKPANFNIIDKVLSSIYTEYG